MMKLEHRLKNLLEETLVHEEIFWHQKSRVQWLQAGDQNTKFFHLTTIIRRRRNKAEALQSSDGSWVQDQLLLKDMVADYFRELYASDINTGGNFITGQFPLLTSTLCSKLRRRYSTEEIHDALTSMGPLKAPGSDGFNAAFYQRTWEITGPSLTSSIISMLNGEEFDSYMDSALMVLIPKVTPVETVKHFRPISLCNVSFKLLTKVLVNRLKQILPIVIAPTQCSFVPGRHITDNVAVCQEMIHSLRNKHGKRGGMVLKIDLEKAYDRLEWPFIEETLRDVGLPNSMVDVIMKCVSSASFQLLWNGDCTETIGQTRGLRQGDPLSPYLFVLCLERLSQRIQQEVNKRTWRPLRASRSGTSISHIFFADDLMLFAESSVEQLDIIKQCLLDFSKASGQRISFEKSSIVFSPNVSSEEQSRISRASGIPIASELGKYLGVHLVHGRHGKKHYRELLEKVHKRLSEWKMNSLSLAGRVTLAASTIASLPIYAMQTSQLPKAILHDIDKNIRRSVWGSSDIRRKVHLVSWSTICRPKKYGGLGLRPAAKMNQALLIKLAWRLVTEPSALWSRLLKEKYGNYCTSFSRKLVHLTFGVEWWRQLQEWVGYSG